MRLSIVPTNKVLMELGREESEDLLSLVKMVLETPYLFLYLTPSSTRGLGYLLDLRAEVRGLRKKRKERT